MTEITKHQISDTKKAPITKLPVIKRRFDLEERAVMFAKRVICLCKSLEYNVMNQELVSQLVRASGSVGANYREANDALSKKDFAHRIKIARREAKEAHYWLQLVAAANDRLSMDVGSVEQEALELKRILSAIAEQFP